MHSRLLVWISALLIGIASAQASALNLLQYQHENLRSGQLESLINHNGDISLMMFFEPNCAWCYKQVKAFNQISTQCRQVSITALGINGKRHQLKKDLWRLKPLFPAFIANASMIAKIGAIPATPITLIIDKQGHYLDHLRGYISSDKVLAQLAAQHGINCEAPQVLTHG